jgi:diguanylate cyclase (GGDEF)-like protein
LEGPDPAERSPVAVTDLQLHHDQKATAPALVDRAPRAVSSMRRVAAIGCGFALAVAALGLASGSPPMVFEGLLAAGLSAWVWWASRPGAGRDLAARVRLIAVAILVCILATGFLTPATAAAAPLGALLAVILALPYVGTVALRQLMVAAFAVAIAVTVLLEAGWLPDPLPESVSGPMHILGVVAGTSTVLLLLWHYRGQLAASSREMGRMMDLSRDLAQTLDPLQVGERLARHLTEATAADDCTISSYDAGSGRVVTFASYPAENAQQYEPSYDLDDFPLTCRVLERREVVSLHVDDPDVDAAEARLLRGEGKRALLMVPLVARGETIGLVEITRDGERFDVDAETVAWSVASEAAMTLENARLYQELRHQAFHDGLTRLPNRALFNDRLRHALARSMRTGDPLAVLFIDIDAFKTVNDRFGHERGDQLLRTVADRLRGCVRESDTAARMGGDEFAVILEDLGNPFEAEVVSRRILAAMAAPVRLGDAEVSSGVSIGICHSGREGETAETMVRDADFAMYRAKSLGKGRAEVFRGSLRAAAAQRDETERQLRASIERGDLRLRWQPIIALDTGSVTAVEALVRWRSADGRLRRPHDFIPLAEETGLIIPMGRWVLREACSSVRSLQQLLGRDINLAVNLSARQFQGPWLQDDIEAALLESGLAPSSLVLELTESVLMQHTPTTIATLESLRKGGIRVAVDDFGTGYSSLAYLQRFPVDVLKIDRSFVESADRPDGSVLARAVIELGRALRLEVVAEGIEDVGQLQAMRAFGCGFGQGFLFAAPLEREDLARLLTEGPRAWESYWGGQLAASRSRSGNGKAAPVAWAGDGSAPEPAQTSVHAEP